MTIVVSDSDIVVKVIAAKEINPFIVETTHVTNLSTGHCADNDVKDNLIM